MMTPADAEQDPTVKAIQDRFPGATVTAVRTIEERVAPGTFIRVIDYETSGDQSSETAEIIEFGSHDLYVEDCTITAPFRSFCRPRHPIHPAARAAHHIRDEELADAPDAREIIDEFLTGGKPFALAAHNIDFEQHFSPDVGLPWICTYRCAKVVWPDAPGHSNQTLRYWLDLKLDFDRCMPPHRALPDSYVTAGILARLLQEKTVDELIQISKYPPLHKTLTFGKHKGTTYLEAPQDYLEWILNKSDLDEATKFSAKYWLKKKREMTDGPSLL